MSARHLPTFLFFVIGLLPAFAVSAESVPIARDAAAQQAIVVAADASDSVRQSAATLAE